MRVIQRGLFPRGLTSLCTWLFTWTVAVIQIVLLILKGGVEASGGAILSNFTHQPGVGLQTLSQEQISISYLLPQTSVYLGALR